MEVGGMCRGGKCGFSFIEWAIAMGTPIQSKEEKTVKLRRTLAWLILAYLVAAPALLQS